VPEYRHEPELLVSLHDVPQKLAEKEFDKFQADVGGRRCLELPT
jgi:hypothetical protein